MKKTHAVLTIILAVTACDKFNNTITVTNGSEMTVSEISVSVCDSSWTISELAPGESREFACWYNCDDQFKIETPELSGNFGYVTSSMTEDRVVITLQRDSIQFVQTKENY